MSGYAKALSGLIRAACIVLVATGLLYLGMALVTFSGALLKNAAVLSLVTLFNAHMPLPSFSAATALSPMGGVLHVDYLLMGVLLVLVEWPLSRLGDAVVNKAVQR